MKKLLILVFTCLLLLSATACTQNEMGSDPGIEETQGIEETPAIEEIPEIESMFENTLQQYTEQMGYEDKRLVQNFESLKALHYKAYAYCTRDYFVQTAIKNGDEERTIKTFVQDKNVRIEEYLGDKLAYVQVYTVDDDIYYEYDASSGDVKKITSAAQKCWDMGGYDYGFFQWKSCNAPQGERSETELNGRKAELYDYDMGTNGYNGVWYDAEYGIPMQFTQGKWTEVYTVVPRTSFDSTVFTFDLTMPSVPLSLSDIHSVNMSSDGSSQNEMTDPADSDNKITLETLDRIPDFSATDMNGTQVSNEIFSEYKLTLVNLWGTWCSPCVAEMPDLQKLYEKYNEDGLNVIGVTEDAYGNEELIQKIVETQGVNYMILYPSDQFYDDFVSLCFSFPSSLLVDSDGKVLTTVMGVPGYEKLDGIVADALQQ